MICGETLKLRSQKYEQTLPVNCLKSTKMAITVCKFSKFSGEACPRTPLESFLLLSCLKLTLPALPEKNKLKKVAKFGAPFLKKKNAEYTRS